MKILNKIKIIAMISSSVLLANSALSVIYRGKTFRNRGGDSSTGNHILNMNYSGYMKLPHKENSSQTKAYSKRNVMVLKGGKFGLMILERDGDSSNVKQLNKDNEIVIPYYNGGFDLSSKSPHKVKAKNLLKLQN